MQFLFTTELWFSVARSVLSERVFFVQPNCARACVRPLLLSCILLTPQNHSKFIQLTSPQVFVLPNNLPRPLFFQNSRFPLTDVRRVWWIKPSKLCAYSFHLNVTWRQLNGCGYSKWFWIVMNMFFSREFHMYHLSYQGQPLIFRQPR